MVKQCTFGRNRSSSPTPSTCARPLCRFYVCGKVSRPFHSNLLPFLFFHFIFVLFLARNSRATNLEKSERQKSSTFHNYVMCFAIKMSCILAFLISLVVLDFSSAIEYENRMVTREVRKNSTKLIIISKGKFRANCTFYSSKKEMMVRSEFGALL